MLLYTMLSIVLAYLMLFAALTNSVCLNNASFFFLFKYFLCQGYELSGEIALKNNHYYYLLLYGERQFSTSPGGYVLMYMSTVFLVLSCFYAMDWLVSHIGSKNNYD